MLIFVLFVTLALAGPLSSAILGGSAAMPLSLGMPLWSETPLCPPTPHFNKPSHLVQHSFDKLSQSFCQQLALRCLPLEIPLVLSCDFLHETFPLATCHLVTRLLTTCLLATCHLGFFPVADHFVCQHKGRALWDTHSSCVTCRIRQDILCSRDNPCKFCSSWSEREWVFQDQRVDKIRRDWVFSLKQQTPKALSTLSTPRGAASTSDLPGSVGMGKVVPDLCPFGARGRRASQVHLQGGFGQSFIYVPVEEVQTCSMPFFCHGVRSSLVLKHTQVV